MSRRLFAGLLGVAFAAAAGLPSAAQEKKDPPKKKERIAVADPEKAKADPDFLTQGEYVGGAGSGNKSSPLGAQVVAKGNGEFDVKVYAGGLPGAGWDGKTVMKGTARRDGDRVAVTGKDVSGGDFTGTLSDGKFALKTLAGEGA